MLGLAFTMQAAPPLVGDVLERLQCLSFDDFVNECYRQIMLRDPDTLWAYGMQDEYGLASFADWTDLSAEGIEETQRLDRSLLELLKCFDRTCLTPEQQLEYDIHEWFLEDRIQLHPFPFWKFALAPSAYGAQNQGLETLLYLPIETIQDAEDYVARLEGTATWMSQLIDGFRVREQAGDVPPQIVIDLALGEVDGILTGIPDRSLSRQLPAYTTFVERLDQVEDLEYTVRAELLEDARAAVIASVIPAYRELREYIVSLDGRAGPAGVYGREDHEAFYTAVAHRHITKSMTPGELVELGEQEVARLQSEIRTLGSETFGWPTDLSMNEYNALLNEANVPVLQGEALLPLYEELVAEATAALPTVFDIFPSADLVVTVEPEGAPAYYREPPLDGSGPGEVVVSLLNIVPFTPYDEPVLMHHEGNPGHHFQLAIQRDLETSLLRRDRMSSVYLRHPVFQGYMEGWALYSEPLAHEMGLYDDDPLGALTQKRLELVRTARIVADVGLNAFGWSWEEAADYLLEAGGRPIGATGVLRYDCYPGQALAYNVGYLSILGLRRQAEERLGDAFDLKAFHRIILENGVIPIEILERIVEDWIADRLCAG